MSRDFQKELQGFEKVWKRVAQEKLKLPESVRLMPRRSRDEKPRNGRGK